jgi:hypothetical protein
LDDFYTAQYIAACGQASTMDSCGRAPMTAPTDADLAVPVCGVSVGCMLIVTSLTLRTGAVAVPENSSQRLA